jgi:dihydrofolate synthase / folylpolyglutamate synthase
MRFLDAVAELDSRKETRMVPDLSRILRLATLLNDPQLGYPSIHVTGTNGKGTAARVASAVACAHGITAGQYTSPHLRSVTERLSVCGVDIQEREFGEEYEHLLPYFRLVDEESDDRVTYFEALTALAYVWFADKPVGLGIFEVGMGGEWDATNLVAGDVAVLTPISLDHPELGDTVTAVAREKAGIIKEGKVVVSREQSAEALDVIEARCAAVGAELRLEFHDWELEERLLSVGGQSLVVRGARGTYPELFLPMLGEHAARNAAAAVVAFEALTDERLDQPAVAEALAGVSWPGRLEIVQRHPTVVLDGAHNPAAAEALADAMRESFVWGRLHLVISVSGNKDLAGILRELAPLTDVAYAARNASERSGDARPLAEHLGADGTPVTIHDSVAKALDAARSTAGEDDLILVTGSLYTVADARRALEGSAGDR